MGGGLVARSFDSGSGGGGEMVFGIKIFNMVAY